MGIVQSSPCWRDPHVPRQCSVLLRTDRVEDGLRPPQAVSSQVGGRRYRKHWARFIQRSSCVWACGRGISWWLSVGSPDRRAGVGPSFAADSLCDIGPGTETEPPQASVSPTRTRGNCASPRLLCLAPVGCLIASLVIRVKWGSWECWAGVPCEAVKGLRPGWPWGAGNWAPIGPQSGGQGLPVTVPWPLGLCCSRCG